MRKLSVLSCGSLSGEMGKPAGGACGRENQPFASSGLAKKKNHFRYYTKQELGCFLGYKFKDS